MNLDLFIILIVYALMIAYVLFAVKGNVWNKIITFSFATFVAVYSVFLVQQYRGFAVDLKPNHPVKLISISVIKPDYGSEGGIYIWGFEDTRTPRSWRIPYTEDKDKRFNAAKKKLENGYIVIYNGEPLEESGKGSGKFSKGKPGKSREGEGDGTRSNSEPDLHIINPEDSLLSKDDSEILPQ